MPTNHQTHHSTSMAHIFLHRWNDAKLEWCRSSYIVSGIHIRHKSGKFLQYNGPFWRRRELAHFVHQITCFEMLYHTKNVKGIFCQKGILYYSYVNISMRIRNIFPVVAWQTIFGTFSEYPNIGYKYWKMRIQKPVITPDHCSTHNNGAAISRTSCHVNSSTCGANALQLHQWSLLYDINNWQQWRGR